MKDWNDLLWCETCWSKYGKNNTDSWVRIGPVLMPPASLSKLFGARREDSDDEEQREKDRMRHALPKTPEVEDREASQSPEVECVEDCEVEDAAEGGDSSDSEAWGDWKGSIPCS